MNKDWLIRQDLIRETALIDGAWAGARQAPRFEVLNPADETTIATVADCGVAEAQAAMDAAYRAFKPWRAISPLERARVLKRWHALIVDNAEDLARLISLEQGKPLSESRAEIAYGAGYVEWFAEEARRIDGRLLGAAPAGRTLAVLREPVGVVLAVTPWNFPMAMLARKLAPALAAGCTVVAKPAEDTPLSALALGALAMEAGLPGGTVNILPASRAQAGRLVASCLDDPRLAKLSFTGSTAVGRMLAEHAGRTVKRVSLELGGNAPLVVFDDADLSKAVGETLRGKFRNTGQTCIAPNRIFVHRRLYEPYLRHLSAAVGDLRIGVARHSDADLGPLINSAAVAKVQRHIDDALQHGARDVCAMQQVPQGPLFVAPRVLADMGDDALVNAEETFGPLAAVTPFDDDDEVIARANATPAGLAAYCFTTSLSRVARLMNVIEAGMLGVNTTAISTEVAPFGGIKASGYGREGSRHGLDDYLHLKYVALES